MAGFVFRFLGVFLDGLNGLLLSTDIALYQDEGGGALEPGIEFSPGAVAVNGTRQTFIGKGNGPIDAFVHAIRGQFSGHLDVKDYSEHALGQGSQATAVAYVETGDDSGHNRWGVGIDPNTITASLRAVLSAFQRHETTRNNSARD